MKKNIFKIIGIIVLIIFIVMCIYIIRNTIIIGKLSSKENNLFNSENYHIESIRYFNSETIFKCDYYQKNDKQLVLMERNNNGQLTKISLYNSGNRIDKFIETNDEKIAEIGTINEIIFSKNYLQMDNLWQKLLCSSLTKIKIENVNGIKCYKISNFLSPNIMQGNDKTELYVEKETGLTRKIVIDDDTEYREYEFENVDDQVFKEPDIGEYKIN